MPQTTNGEVTLYYEDEGSGPPVLLIHGHTMDRRIWEPVMSALLGANLRVLRPDLRGHGCSSRPDFGYHVSHHAADMASVLDHCGAGSAAIVGYSIGGGVALEMALTRAERVTGLVLMSPVMPDRPFEQIFMENLREVARVTRSDGLEAAMLGPWAANPLFAHSFSKPGIRDTVLVINRDFPGAEYLATRRDRIERDWKVPDRLHEIATPTAVIAGDCETPGFRAYAEEAAAGIPGATIEFFEDCGHLLPLEEPERGVKCIIESEYDRRLPIPFIVELGLIGC